ncbi:MAG: transposase zinc-binding domain-containing protein, partial [Rhodomicrobium sp.]
MPRPALEVAEIFRSHGPAWRKANAGHLSLGQLKAMAAIEACRTAELGGHVARCEDCGHAVISYNSCVMCTSSNGELTRLLPHFPVHRRTFTLHYTTPLR